MMNRIYHSSRGYEKDGREIAEARRADSARGGEINFTDCKIIETNLFMFSVKSMRLLFYSAILISLFFNFGCRRVSEPSYAWNPKVDLLDKAEQNNPQIVGFSDDVKTFYEDLHDKRWEETYKYRNKSFRELVPLETYLNNVHSQPWNLLNYEVLNVQTENTNKITLVCKFIEDPLKIESYNTVIWKKEDGKWRCDPAGPIGLPVFAKLTKQE
jgi:hypothetical protein